MKKKFVTSVLIILIIVIGIVFSFIIYKNYKEDKKQKRYNEIRESVKKASEHYLHELYPNCVVSKGTGETYTPGIFFNSSWLLSNGLIKKNELLDIDKKSYCDVYVKAMSHFENLLDQQGNCEVYYKIYLKCKNYEDKGYIAE